MRKAIQKLLLKTLRTLVAEGNAFWYEKGYKDGYETGRETGYTDGWREGHTQGTQDASPFIIFRPTAEPRNDSSPACPCGKSNQGAGPTQ
jgi:flagellar biosynthesis/type III secretory pathway protein FliH